jgi:hypothetical protein
MTTNAPIKIASATAEVEAARHAAMLADRPMPYGNGYLFLDHDSTLAITPQGQLTVVGGGPGSFPEAPIDSTSYGRMNAGWTRVLAITGDVLDGGNF